MWHLQWSRHVGQNLCLKKCKSGENDKYRSTSACFLRAVGTLAAYSLAWQAALTLEKVGTCPFARSALRGCSALGLQARVAYKLVLPRPVKTMFQSLWRAITAPKITPWESTSAAITSSVLVGNREHVEDLRLSLLLQSIDGITVIKIVSCSVYIFRDFYSGNSLTQKTAVRYSSLPAKWACFFSKYIVPYLWFYFSPSCDVVELALLILLLLLVL